jgi:hypothetical protein
MRKILLTGIAASLVFTASALAQTTVTEYYVVHDQSTKRCTVVSERPTVSTVVVVGDRGYKTRTEAEGVVKTTKVCTAD